MQPIRAVIFDLGRVLVGLDLERGLFGRLARLAAAEGADPVTGAYADSLYVDYATGRIPPAEFHRRLCARAGLELDYEQFVAAWCDVFVPMPEMRPLLEAVAARWPVGLLSDTDPLHWAHQRRRMPWLACIRQPCLSFELGALKPDPACYRAAARSVGQPEAACLFIDDLERNVAGARAAGMQALRFEDPAGLRRRLLQLGVLDAGQQEEGDEGDEGDEGRRR